MIKPAIIPKSITDLQIGLTKLSFADQIQIDVVDGKFVNDISWPYEPAGQVAEIASLLALRDVEVDLMVYDAVAAGSEWLQAGARTLVFHLESLDRPEDVLALADRFACSIGLSLNNDTPLEELYPFMHSLDFVQLMGIKKIGSQGQPFDDRVLGRVATLVSKYPNVPISVDGGVNDDTIVSLKNAGASRFVVGSAILNAADPENKYFDLLKIVS